MIFRFEITEKLSFIKRILSLFKKPHKGVSGKVVSRERGVVIINLSKNS